MNKCWEKEGNLNLQKYLVGCRKAIDWYLAEETVMRNFFFFLNYTCERRFWVSGGKGSSKKAKERGQKIE